MLMLSNPTEKEEEEEEEEEKKEYECCICLENIADNAIILPCNHIFHVYCIIHWTITRIKNDTYHFCPFCKSKYNYKALISDIISELREKINTNQKNLDLISKNCILDKYEKERILNYKKEYNKKLILVNTHNTETAKLQLLLEIRIMPLPNDLILLSKILFRTKKQEDFNCCLCSCLTHLISNVHKVC